MSLNALAEQHRKDRIRADARKNLRDHFAGQAIGALISAITTSSKGDIARAAEADGYAGSVDGYAAHRAYRVADAMLAERDREEPSK